MSLSQFFELDRQYSLIKDRLDKRFKAVLRHGRFINGPEVFELEQKLSAFTGAPAVAVNSGTSALMTAFMALDLQPGDEVISSPVSFGATALSIRLVGATPVFADIEEETGLLKAASVEKAISRKTKAILPVSLYGQPADMLDINKTARKHGLKVIEDACQSFGASYRGKKSAALSDFAAVSFFPAKPLGAYGNAGCVFAKSKSFAKKLKKIRDQGRATKSLHERLGFNGLMNTFQAVVLLEKLRLFNKELKIRQKLARRYDKAFEGLAPKLCPTALKIDRTSARSYYVLRSAKKSRIQRHFKKNLLELPVHYSTPLFDQPALKKRCKVFCDPIKIRKWTSQIFSLPLYPYLKEREQDRIIKTLKEAF